MTEERTPFMGGQIYPGDAPLPDGVTRTRSYRWEKGRWVVNSPLSLDRPLRVVFPEFQKLDPGLSLTTIPTTDLIDRSLHFLKVRDESS